jgi:hypothetical protein
MYLMMKPDAWALDALSGTKKAARIARGGWLVATDKVRSR